MLVCFKLGAFLVLSLLELSRAGTRWRRLAAWPGEPFLAAAMFISGCPSLAFHALGFVSKLLVIMGIVKVV